MPAWSTFLVMVLVVFVAIAPRRVLGPVIRVVGRRVGAGVVALACLGAAIWPVQRSGLHALPRRRLGTLAVGGVAPHGGSTGASCRATASRGDRAVGSRGLRTERQAQERDGIATSGRGPGSASPQKP